MPKLLNVLQLAKYLGCSRQQVLALLGAGALKGFKVANKWRITEENVMKFIQLQEELTGKNHEDEESTEGEKK
jgi:excisionase family DNA binding protein